MTNETTQPKEFKIPTMNLGSLTEKIEKLNKRAAKLQQAAIVMNVGQPFTEKVAEGTNAFGEVTYRTYSFVTVTFSGVAPKIAGWTLMAALDFVGDAAVVRSVPGAVVPDEYRTTDGHCDHCKTARTRRNVFVLFNEETGRFQQVGRQCIADFLGVDAERFFQIASFLKSLDTAIREEEDLYDGPRGSLMIFLPNLLAYAAKAIRLFGWTSASAARDREGLVSTLDRAMDFLFPPRSLSETERREMVHLEPADESLGNLALEWVRSLQATSEYEHNIATIGAQDWITMKHAGFAASIVKAYLNYTGKLDLLSRRAAEAAEAGPAPSGRVTVTGTVLSIKRQESMYRDGVDFKMLVKLDNGSRAWGTVPSFVFDLFDRVKNEKMDTYLAAVEEWHRAGKPEDGKAKIEALHAEYYSMDVDTWVKSQPVAFTATFEPKEQDKTFAYFSRPVAPKAGKKNVA